MPPPKFRRCRKIKRTGTDRRIGKKVTVSERKSVRQQIERWPRVAEEEMSWVKNLGKPLISATPEKDPRFIARGRRGVISDLELVKKSDIFIHTHPEKSADKAAGKVRVMPSANDMAYFYDLARAGPEKTMAIASVRKNGRVSGYCSVKLRKRSKRKESMKKLFALIDIIGAGSWGIELRWKRMPFNVLYESLKEAGFNLKFIPTEGHSFNRKEFIFERKKLSRRIRERIRRKKKK